MFEYFNNLRKRFYKTKRERVGKRQEECEQRRMSFQKFWDEKWETKKRELEEKRRLEARVKREEQYEMERNCILGRFNPDKYHECYFITKGEGGVLEFSGPYDLADLSFNPSRETAWGKPW